MDGQSGQWILNQDPTAPEPFIQIDWNRSLTGEVADIKYLINSTPNSNDNGSFISFQISDSDDFDRANNIFSNPNNNTTEIEWSSTQENGRVKGVRHFGDDAYHYWDEVQEGHKLSHLAHLQPWHPLLNHKFC